MTDQKSEASLLGEGTVLRRERDAFNGQMTKASNK